MKHYIFWATILIFSLLSISSCDNCNTKDQIPLNVHYDMRNDLNPSRLTIAMWDFSWIYMHYPGGAFENFNKVTDELIERGFNTVRIDAFPLIIGKLDSLNQIVTIEGDPLRNWGPSDKDMQHTIVSELVEFMQITKEKGLYVILSSWGFGCKEYPEILNDYADQKTFWFAWEKTIDILAENDLLGHVLYVDFDQEFPYFSPFNSKLNEFGKAPSTKIKDKMEAAGQVELSFEKYAWNNTQM
jgi:hypothetical protein